MAVQIERRLFTLDEYEGLIAAGVFGEEERLELIRGEIVKISPINYPHALCVARLTTLFVISTVDRAFVWPQNNPLRISDHSRPEPDLTLLRWRDDLYAYQPPVVAEDVLLVVEVADTSLPYDRRVKGPLYAEAGIPEYWLVNLRDQVIEIYTDPVEGKYRQTRKARRGEILPLPGGLPGTIEVSAILAPKENRP